MDCNAAQLALSARLDGELSPAEEQALQEHLARCSQCRALQEELSALHTILNELEPPAVPPELKARVMANLPPQEKAGRKVVWLHWKRWGAMAAVAAIVIAAAVWLRMPSPAQLNAPVAEAPSDSNAEAAITAGVAPTNAGDEVAFAIEGGGTQDIVDYATGSQSLPEDLARAYEENGALGKYAGTTEVTGAPAPSAEGSDPGGAEDDTVYAGYRMAGGVAVSSTSDAAAADVGQDEPYWNMAIAAKTAITPDVAPTLPDNDEVVEALPESITEEKIMLKNEELEEIAQFPDAFSGYLATLTIPSAPDRLLQGYYYTTREDGATLYRLPAAQFNALLAELEAGGAEFDLDTSEASPAAAYGLVIITVLIE